MKVSLSNEDLIIYINKKLIDFDIYNKEKMLNFIKKIVINLTKNKLKISGFYKVKVYHNKNYGLIFKMHKEDSLDFFPDLIDLKLTIYYDTNMYLECDDYFIIKDYPNIKRINDKWYININDIKEKDYIKYCEFFKLIYENK